MENSDNSLGIGTYEQNVYAILKACLTEKESVTLHPQFDFYAPKGIRLLNWPAKTAVEVKYRLIYDTLPKIKFLYDNNQNWQQKFLDYWTLKESCLKCLNFDIIFRSDNIADCTLRIVNRYFVAKPGLDFGEAHIIPLLFNMDDAHIVNMR